MILSGQYHHLHEIAVLTWRIDPIGILVRSDTHPINHVLWLVPSNFRDGHQTRTSSSPLGDRGLLKGGVRGRGTGALDSRRRVGAHVS